MTKHTLGPWKYNVWDWYIDIVCPWNDTVTPQNAATFGSSHGAHIATIKFNDGVPTKDQAEANARLIAAAPEMLEALMEVTRHTDNDFLYTKANEAIAKATGQSDD